MPNSNPSNEEIAQVLQDIAQLLEAQDANVHRVRAYREGASSLRDQEQQVAALAKQDGREALKQIPGIGDSLAGLIREYVDTGRSGLRSRLRGEVSPEDLFVEVPGIGERLAARISEELEVETLEELEQAAHDGRLEQVEGFGPKRLRGVRVGLSGMLSRAAQRRVRRIAEGDVVRSQEHPSVETLLEVDREYRRRAEAGELREIAPKRFNPQGETWLPIMHTELDEWNFTALFSNTKRAHDLGKTHDWVVIYYERDGEESQATVVTGNRGELQGKRVVRGREAECRRYYRKTGR